MSEIQPWAREGRAGAGAGPSLALGVPAALAQPQHQTTSLASPALQSGIVLRLWKHCKSQVCCSGLNVCPMALKKKK